MELSQNDEIGFHLLQLVALRMWVPDLLGMRTGVHKLKSLKNVEKSADHNVH